MQDGFREYLLMQSTYAIKPIPNVKIPTNIKYMQCQKCTTTYDAWWFKHRYYLYYSNCPFLKFQMLYITAAIYSNPALILLSLLSHSAQQQHLKIYLFLRV